MSIMTELELSFDLSLSLDSVSVSLDRVPKKVNLKNERFV
jgi:hypothetical protein